jgi:hypothetical protein
MARSDGRIEPGQRVGNAISAKAWNRAQDAADVVLGDRPQFSTVQGPSLDQAANIVMVRNDSGENVPWLGVLEFSGVVISPVSGTLGGTDEPSLRAREFARKPVLVGSIPNGQRPFGVAMEPLPTGAIGRMAVGGVFACRVEVTHQAHAFAKAKPGNVYQLKSTDCGTVEILWKEPGVSPTGPTGPTGISDGKWAVGVI